MFRLWSSRASNLWTISNARVPKIGACLASTLTGESASENSTDTNTEEEPFLKPIHAKVVKRYIDTDSAFSRIMDLPKLDLDPKDNLPADGRYIVGYSMHCQFTRNNCMYSLSKRYRRVGKRAENLSDIDKIIDIIRPQSEVVECVTSGTVGFRNAAKASYEASFQAASELMRRITEKDILKSHKLEIIFKDFAEGREAFINVLNGKEGTKIRPAVYRVTDRTIIKFGGHRPPNKRKV